MGYGLLVAIKQKKDVKPDTIARFTLEAPENRPVHRNEQRRSPTPNMYITPHYTDSSNGEDTPLATRHSLGRYITHPRDIHRCFVFDGQLKFSQDFKSQNQNVVNAFP